MDLVTARLVETMTSSNLEKHTSKNPLVRMLNDRLVDTVCDLSLKNKPKRILDAGCGEGFMIKEISKKNEDVEIIGFDLEESALKYARKMNPNVEFVKGSVYKMPFENSSFDVVVLSEVLEHLEDTEKALDEIKRVSKLFCVVSVPNEPYFRLGNITRFAYLSRFGNTPGHINNWSRKSFVNMVSKKLEVSEVRMTFPWVAVLCKKN